MYLRGPVAVLNHPLPHGELAGLEAALLRTCVCMCVYVYIYIYIYMYNMYIDICIYACTYVYVYIHIYQCCY